MRSPSRTRRFLRKSSETIQKALANPVYEFGPFRLDTAEQQLLRAGKAVPLTPKVYELLQLLVENSGHMLGKDELMKAVWPDSFVEEGNLTRNISTLRAALGENLEEHQYIETIPKRGYRFVASVRKSQDESAKLVVAESTRAHTFIEEEEVSRQGAVETVHELAVRNSVVPHPALSAEYIVGGIKSHKRSMALALATLAIAVAAVVYFFYFTKGGAAIDSVAVLPFVNVSADPNTDYLSDGLSDSIINSLSQLPKLKVIALNSVLRYKGKQTDAQVVGRELSVRAVLMGRLVQHGDDLSISIELVDVRDNRRLWGEQYNRKLADILVVQDEIAQQISERLRLRLSGGEKQLLAKHYTENPAAYLLYQQGRDYVRSRTRAGTEKGIEYLEEAIQKDPAYALARVWLALAYGDVSSPLPFNEVRPKVESLLLKALELDNDLAEAHALLGGLRQDDGDWPAAERECKRALDLDPSSVVAHNYYAAYLTRMGRHDEAIAEMERAQELDPLSVRLHADMGYALYFARRYDQAAEQLKKTIDMDQNSAPAHARLGLTYLQQGMHKAAILELERARALDNSPERAGRFAWLAYAYAVSGQRDRAQQMLAELKEQAKQRHIPPQNFAIIHTGRAFAKSAWGAQDKPQSLFNVRRIEASRLRDMLPAGLPHQAQRQIVADRQSCCRCV